MKNISHSISGELHAGTCFDVRGSGSPIVLIHDLCLDRSIWSDAFVNELSSDHQVIRYDLLGHGWSAKPPGKYFLDSFITQLDWLLEHLEITSCCLLGDGAGAMLACHYAATSKNITSILGINCPYSRPIFDWDVPTSVLRRGNEDAVDQAFKNSIKDWISPAYLDQNPHLYQEVRKMLKKCDLFAYKEAFRLLLNPDVLSTSIADDVLCPVLTLNGEQDPCCSKEQALKMTNALLQARLEMIDGIGHITSYEHPEVLLGALSNMPDGKAREAVSSNSFGSEARCNEQYSPQ